MCECAVKVNEIMVKEKGIRLGTTLNFNTGLVRVAIQTEAIAGKKKPKVHIIPSHCPFCGEKYPDQTGA
jgi:hypothetical protein